MDALESLRTHTIELSRLIAEDQQISAEIAQEISAYNELAERVKGAAQTVAESRRPADEASVTIERGITVGIIGAIGVGISVGCYKQVCYLQKRFPDSWEQSPPWRLVAMGVVSGAIAIVFLPLSLRAKGAWRERREQIELLAQRYLVLQAPVEEMKLAIKEAHDSSRQIRDRIPHMHRRMVEIHAELAGDHV